MVVTPSGITISFNFDELLNPPTFVMFLSNTMIPTPFSYVLLIIGAPIVLSAGEIGLPSVEIQNNSFPAGLSVIEEINSAFGDHIEDEFLAIIQARVDKYTAELEAL